MSGRKELAQAAAAHLAEAGDNWEQAAESLLSELLDDQGLLLDAAIYAASRLIREASHRKRSGLRSASRLHEISALGGWYGYILRGGLHLGDATRSALVVEINWHRKLQVASGRAADWLQAIADQLPDDNTPVRAVLSEAAIAVLDEQAAAA